MIRILHIVSSLSGGGVEKMLENYYNNINKEEIKFDFIVHGYNKGMLEDILKKQGAEIYHVTPKKDSAIKNIKEIYKIIKNNNYDIVHCHQNFSSFTSLYLAKKCKVPIRIIHSHGYQEVEKANMKLMFLRYINMKYANYYFACGESAGKWLYGKKWKSNEKFKIMNNAINIEKFEFRNQIRQEYRKKYNITEKEKILLHVGRLSVEKNHMFLIELMEDLVKIKKDLKLFLVGDGILRDKIEEKIKECKLENNIILLGLRDDISNLMSMSDVLLLPSLHEGLGIVTIEAQSNGLKVLASNKVPKEANITDLVSYIPLENKELWLKELKNIENLTRVIDYDKEKFKNFDIKENAKKYVEYLIKILEGEKSGNFYN